MSIYLRAADIIRERGWNDGMDDKPVCLAEALSVAYDGSQYGWTGFDELGENERADMLTTDSSFGETRLAKREETAEIGMNVLAVINEQHPLTKEFAESVNRAAFLMDRGPLFYKNDSVFAKGQRPWHNIWEFNDTACDGAETAIDILEKAHANAE